MQYPHLDTYLSSKKAGQHESMRYILYFIMIRIKAFVRIPIRTCVLYPLIIMRHVASALFCSIVVVKTGQCANGDGHGLPRGREDPGPVVASARAGLLLRWSYVIPAFVNNNTPLIEGGIQR